MLIRFQAKTQKGSGRLSATGPKRSGVEPHSGPSSRTIATSTSWFFRCGLLRSPLASMSALRDIPLFLTRSFSCTFFNAGSIFVCHSSRRGSEYSV